MGMAEIAARANIAKKNARHNISRLFDKLALEILESFESSTAIPRLYRVFSYVQILERRRAAGMEYVLRNKGVMFCTADGSEMIASPVRASASDKQQALRPAPVKGRRVRNTPNQSQAQPQTEIRQDAPQRSQVNERDALIVSQALNQFWMVDEAAAGQLIRACLQIRADATAEEIAYFVSEKADVIRFNKGIQNPTGLLLTMVPNCFAGQPFEQFRQRREEQARLEVEEERRRASELTAMRLWIDQQMVYQSGVLNNPESTPEQRQEASRTIDRFKRFTGI
jgi:hypothetical protein